MNASLSVPFTRDEVKSAIFHTNPPANFYQTYWNIVGDRVTEATLDFLNKGGNLWDIHITRIIIIPKIKNPDNMSHYRPVSLCIFLYKIIAKVLANKLKCILLDIISKNQSAFMP